MKDHGSGKKLQSSLWQIGAHKVHVRYTRVKGWQIVPHKMQHGAGTGWTIYSPQVTRQVNRTQMELIRAAHTQSGGSRWLSTSFILPVLPRVFCLALLLLYSTLFQFDWQPRGFTCTLLPRLRSPCVTLCHFAVVSALSLFLPPSLCGSLWICFCLYMCCLVEYPLNFEPLRRITLALHKNISTQAPASSLRMFLSGLESSFV